MLFDLMQELKDADLQMQSRIDLVGCGIISAIDCSTNQMYINHDYYSWQDGQKCYCQKQKIDDLFSALHWRLYKNLQDVTSIAMFRSRYTTLWAQRGSAIPPLGVLHTEHFYGEIPCAVLPDERDGSAAKYDRNLAKSLVSALGNKTVTEMPAVLLSQFGAFVFGCSPADVIQKAVILEKVADLAWQMLAVDGDKLMYMDYSVMNKFHALRWGDASSYMQRIDSK